MRTFIAALLVAGVLYSPAVSRGQYESLPTTDFVPDVHGPSPEAEEQFELGRPPLRPAPTSVPWVPGHKSRTDWAALIDSTWGPGLPSFDKTVLFDGFWTEVDERFACFHDIDDTWLELRDPSRNEIVGGVSRGRFQGILSRCSLTLRESHTRMYDEGVVFTQASRGVPLLHAWGFGERAGNLGAAVTAQDDGSGLVYRVLEDNPLGLAPGDLILGYDGRPWSECLEELLAAELPITGRWGSSPDAWDHTWATAVGANWHLFDTMDIIEFASGDTLHLATSVVDGYDQPLYASDQMDIGIPFPDYPAGETVTWGVIESGELEIGYIYVFAWLNTAGVDFYEAIDSLTSNPDIAGLIIDFRYNEGGNMFLSDPALRLLFDGTTATIRWLERCHVDDHVGLCVAGGTVFIQDSNDRYYDRPIAVLTGPGAKSSGDQVALRMTLHPTARSFGKTTNTAFNSPEYVQPVDGFWRVVAIYDAARHDAIAAPLTHIEFPADEPVWLTPADVAQGVDTVVETALEWIASVPTGVDDSSRPSSALPAARLVGVSPNPFNPATEIRFSLASRQEVKLSVFDLGGRRVAELVEGVFEAGDHLVPWNGKDATGRDMSSGTYLIYLESVGRVDTKKMVLVR